MIVDRYETASGEVPVEDFIDGLSIKMQAKVIRLIEMLKENGVALRGPYSELLEDGIFELRAKVGSDSSRVLYFFCVDDKAILTHGFIKKTQKTPKSEIKKARQYRKEYLSRQK